MGVKYSIIIPTLNEEAFVSKALESAISTIPNSEIIIVDGGSDDGTLDVCKRFNVRTINSPKGRGKQLNNGASAAKGDILIFLHADTSLPDNAIELIDEFFISPQNNICRFLLGFDFNHKILDLYTAFSKFDTVFTRFGDSAIITRKTLFNKLNGFKNIDTFEDVEFLKRASHISKVVILNGIVESSARRFIQNGVIRQQLLNIFLFIGYLLNFKNKTLSKIYNRKISKNKFDSIIIFLRYPEIGEVKTRLAKTTSSEFAVKFYKICAEYLIKIIKQYSNINKFVFYSNKLDREKIIKWLGGKLFYAYQEGDDLGIRMKNAFEKVFSIGSKKVIIIGTDIPDITKELINNTFSLLEINDVVIGPSDDGGYYLLGLKQMYNELFEGIEYSTSSVLLETLIRIKNLNLKYHLLPILPDIDTEEDLINWINNNNRNEIKNEIKLSYKPV